MITMTPMQLAAIQRELDEVQGGHAVKEIRIERQAGTFLLVTLDAGWGTYSFYVYVGGETRQAGLGIGAVLAE